MTRNSRTSAQIDQLSESTNFNGVQLLNGSIAGGATLSTNANAGNSSSAITSAAIITIGGALNSGDTVTVNGATLTLKSSTVDLSGSSNNNTAANIAAALNNAGSAALAGYRFSASGATVVSTYIGGATATPPGFTVSKANGTNVTVANATFAQGTTAATIAATLATDTIIVNGVSIVAGTAFTVPGAVATDATALANYLNATSNSAWAGIHFSTDGSTGKIYADYTGVNSPSLTITDSTNAGSVTGGGTPLILKTQGAIGLSAGTTLSVGSVSGQGLFVTGGSTAGNAGQAVDLSSINSNASFIGSFGGTGNIGAIKATYNGGATPSVTFSVVVGKDTYTASATVAALTNSTPVTTLLVFNGKNTTSGATEGGSFTLTLQSGQANITNQQGADNLVAAMNAGLSTVSAYQNRTLQSYNNNFTAQVGSTITGVLSGSSISWNSNDFTNPLISDVSVSAPGTGETDAKISMVVNGETYSTQAGIGSLLTTDKVYTLVNQSNPKQMITFTTGNVSTSNTLGSGNTAVDLTSSSNAAAFETALSNALGISSANSSMVFQVGSTTSATIGVSLQSASTNTLFGGQSLDVSSASDASNAYNVVTTALDTVGSYRAGVGALELAFQYASAAAQSGQQNESAAASDLLDTDVASASTSFATAQVQLQAGIAVLAQANQLQQAVLKKKKEHAKTYRNIKI